MLSQLVQRSLLYLFLLLGTIGPSSAYGSVSSSKNVKKIPFASLPQHVKPLIVLDPGHGGADEGAKMHSIKEKKINLATALHIKKCLDKMGYRVILTRKRDVYLPLSKRVDIANKTKASLFVSLHYNSSPRRDAQGIEVFYCAGKNANRSDSSKKLAHTILYHLLDSTQAESRGVKSGNYHVIRETQMPAVLVEGGFITNKYERSLMSEKAYIEKIASGIAKGIDKYLQN